MNILIFGFGYTAGFFVQSFGSRLGRIGATVRTREKAESLVGLGVTPFVFDGTVGSPELAREIHTADGILVSVPPTGSGDPVISAFSEALRDAKRLRWIGYLSTVGVYGDAGGGWVDETSPLLPKNERSRHRVLAEQQWLTLGAALARPVALFRLSGIYGPGRNAVENLRNGTAKRIVKPDQVFNRIHVSDIAQALAASFERTAVSTVYNVTDDEPAPPQDVVAFAAHLLGREPPPEEPFETASLSPMARSFYEDNKRVRNARLKQDLGVALRYPTYREGLQALAAEP